MRRFGARSLAILATVVVLLWIAVPSTFATGGPISRGFSPSEAVCQPLGAFTVCLLWSQGGESGLIETFPLPLQFMVSGQVITTSSGVAVSQSGVAYEVVKLPDPMPLGWDEYFGGCPENQLVLAAPGDVGVFLFPLVGSGTPTPEGAMPSPTSTPVPTDTPSPTPTRTPTMTPPVAGPLKTVLVGKARIWDKFATPPVKYDDLGIYEVHLTVDIPPFGFTPDVDVFTNGRFPVGELRVGEWFEIEVLSPIVLRPYNCGSGTHCWAKYLDEGMVGIGRSQSSDRDLDRRPLRCSGGVCEFDLWFMPPAPTVVPTLTKTPKPTATAIQPTATARATNTPLPTATWLPGVTPTETPVTTPTPTAKVVPTAVPYPTPASIYIADVVIWECPSQVISDALANPESVRGWGETCNPNLRESPMNPLRGVLCLEHPSRPFHPLFNALEWKCSCDGPRHQVQPAPAVPD